MKIVAFGTSSSKNSINKKFAKYVADQFENETLELIDLSEINLPMFSVDYELEIGIPEIASKFYSKIISADFIVISLAEHNGTYTAFFKNLFDWISRIELKFFQNKKIFLLSTSPGGRGGLGVMEAALIRFPIHGAEILNHFSLPFFQKNFNENKGIIDEDLKSSFEKILNDVKTKIL